MLKLRINTDKRAGGPRASTARRASRALLLFAGLSTIAALSACAGSDSGVVYARYAKAMTMSGKFREDYSPIDAPFDKADLIRNFEKVAFEPEAQLSAYYKDRSGGPRRLSKWTQPVRYQLLGDGATPEDVKTLADITATLSRHSGLEIRSARAGEKPSLLIFVVTPKAREVLGAVEGSKAWYRSSLLKEWVETLNPPCFALFDAGHSQGGAIRSGAIFIKAEMKDPLRRACFIEEVTQTLGLVFDHDDVRPSIFNDDQEFIALTRHDVALIEILYDPRLRAGMTQREAGPVVRQIVAERALDPQ